MNDVNSPYKFIEISGTRIRYRIDGEGDEVLLLHGWGGSVESFAMTRHELSGRYKVIALDFPGHGESGLPPEAWGLAKYTQSLIEFMDLLNISRPNIIAHSFGGRITINLAASTPDRVKKIILVDSAGIISPRSLKHYFRVAVGKMGLFIFGYGGNIGRRIRQSIYDKIASPDYKAAGPLRDTFVKIINEDLKEIMPLIQAPTLLVWGENDEETPISSAKTMNKLIPNSDLVILENAGHYSFLDQPIQFRLHIQRFLRQ